MVVGFSYLSGFTLQDDAHRSLLFFQLDIHP